MKNLANRLGNCFCLAIILAGLFNASYGSKSCQNRLDVVFVLDATSSASGASFSEVKSRLKDIAAAFKIGSRDTRLALVSVTGAGSQLVVNFDNVNSHADFNAAVDRVTFASGSGDLAAGMRTARDSALTRARTQKISKILVLVQDRRRQEPRVADASDRARVTAEASAVRSGGASIHAVGVGGLWPREDLQAIFGTEYLLFKNVNKAAESIKSLSNQICEANCPDSGKVYQKQGQCYKNTRQTMTVKVALAVDSSQMSVCRKQIQTDFEKCSSAPRCNAIQRDVGTCSHLGKVEVRSSWQIFNFRKMECVTRSFAIEVDCKDALKCQGQLADILFIIDRSSSLADLFESVRKTARALMQPLLVGAETRVGLMTFDNEGNFTARLGEPRNSAELLAALDSIPSRIDYYGKLTYIDRALIQAMREFRTNGRDDVPKFVFLLTDGESTDMKGTMNAAMAIKNMGVTLYAIGVGKVNVIELKAMTAPETATNLVIMQSLPQMEKWAKDFGDRICIQLNMPDTYLCDDNIYLQTISECIMNTQQITRTEFKYDAKRKCIKNINSQSFQHCRSKCIDPINGNEYFGGDSWKSRCHQFQCDNRQQSSPFFPQASECIASNGQCHSVGSGRFSCIDDKGTDLQNCQCLLIGGKPTIVIDTY